MTGTWPRSRRAARPRLAEAAVGVVRPFKAWGKPEKAAEWRKTLAPPSAGPPAVTPRR